MITHSLFAGPKVKPLVRSIALSLAAITGFIADAALAETVMVKHRGPVDLAPFKCTDITRSSFIRRVCYDQANAYMLIRLRSTYYHYCEIDSDTVAALMTADSMGRYYNRNIKSSGSGGRFDCQTHRVPEY